MREWGDFMIALLLFVTASVTAAQSKPVDRAWAVLEEGVSSGSADKRAKAVHALGLLASNQKAQQMAEKALSDNNPEVRVEGANALGQMNAMSARSRLEQTLGDKDVKVVIAAANSLYILKDPAAYEVYYTLLTGERKGTPGLLQTQLDTLKNRKALEQLAFETGIGFVPFGGMTYQAWKTVMHDGDSPVRAAAAEKLATDPDPKTTVALSRACADKKWRVRAAVVDAIAKRNDPALLDSIVSLMWDENDTVRYKAAAAVLHLSAPTVGPPRKRAHVRAGAAQP